MTVCLGRFPDENRRTVSCMAMKEKILVVDDERVILELTSMILRTRGFEVLCASSAEEGLELVAKERPALVLLDYMMPQMDGMTALRLMRKTYPDTYVIMFTGKGSEEIAVELMRGGASDYILKPFNNQDLVDVRGQRAQPVSAIGAGEHAAARCYGGNDAFLFAAWLPAYMVAADNAAKGATCNTACQLSSRVLDQHRLAVVDNDEAG